jgi:hypothetical protein
VQKPLAACQGKTVPGAVLLVAARRSVPGGPPQKILEADGGGRAAPDPGYRGRRCRIGAGLESEGRHLVLLVADAQREVVQGAANDSVGTAVQQLKQRYMAVQPHEHCQCAARSSGSRGGGWQNTTLVQEVGAVFQYYEYFFEARIFKRLWCPGIDTWQAAAAVLCLVAECSAALSVLENCSRKVLEGSSGESKNWPGKMSGEPNTA